MKELCKRILCCLMVFVLLLSCVLETAITARAAYENTYVNTGDQRKDIMGVALTQVGYREESSGYTKYGDWFGNSKMAWCAAFVCWCADQANIPTSVIRKNGTANASHFGFKTFTVYERMPQPGDFFFKGTSHVGIVYYIDGDSFYTLEGNTWAGSDSHSRVMSRKRDLYDSRFIFASPNYQGSSNASCSHSYVKGSDTAHPHKEYYKCSKCGYFYYTGTNKVVEGCQDCCNHSYSGWKNEDDTYHSAVCSICGKSDKQKHEWGSDEILQEATCKDPGLKKQTCSKCQTVRETEIPATEDHQFDLWMYGDSHNHYRICTVCEAQEEAEHKLSDWKMSDVNHWYECEECKGRLAISSHLMSGECGSTCAICELTPKTVHIFSERWINNGSSHWQYCIHCSKTRGKAEHTYSANCDETCDVCGYVRQVTHNYGVDWDKDSSGHWKTCQTCGKKQTANTHKIGSSVAENMAQNCTVCGFEVVSAKQHIHSFQYSYDDKNHWGTCACGASAPAEGHIWQMESQKCEICQANIPSVETSPVVGGIRLPVIVKASWFWNALFYAAIGVACLVILIMLIAGVRRKIRRSAVAALRREFEEEEALDELDEEEISDQEPVSV